MDNIITLDGKDFLICTEFDMESVHYIYGIALDDDSYVLLKEEIENGEKYVESVKDEDTFKKAMTYIINNRLLIENDD